MGAGHSRSIPASISSRRAPPARGTWTGTANVDRRREGRRLSATVPALGRASARRPRLLRGAAGECVVGDDRRRAPRCPDLAPWRGGQRAAGIVIGAAGLVGLGVGGYFGIAIARGPPRLRRALHRELVRRDRASRSANDAQQSGDDRRRSRSARGAALLGGIITYATAPKRVLPASSGPGRGRRDSPLDGRDRGGERDARRGDVVRMRHAYCSMARSWLGLLALDGARLPR